MRNLLLVPALAFAMLAGACGEDFSTKMCLSDEGTNQDCGIACTISENEKACEKWKKMTTELCGKITKEQCQEICDADKNPTACELAAKM